jgi:hypothetical protein
MSSWAHVRTPKPKHSCSSEQIKQSHTASGSWQSRGLHQMPEHACRWNLAPGLDQRGRVALGHDVGSSDK